MTADTRPAPSLDAPLDELLDWANAAYGVAFEPATVGGVSLEFLQIADMEAHIDHLAAAAGPESLKLPLWSKVWPAALVTSHYLKRLVPDPAATILEIGAGVGVCGLFAAAFGHKTLITDINPDALRFTQINILHNGLADRAAAVRADFSQDRLGRRFPLILGSEILYLDDLHRPLVKFLLAHVEPGPESEIILSCNYLRNAKRFFKLADEEFRLATSTIGCKSAGGDQEDRPQRHLINIHRLTVRKHA